MLPWLSFSLFRRFFVVRVRPGPGFGPAKVVLEQLQTILREQQVRMGEEVANVEVASEDDLGSGQVLERAADHVAWRGKNYQCRVVEADRLDQICRLLGAGFLEAKTVDHSDAPFDRLLREG